MAAIKTIVDEKGIYVAAGASNADTGYQQTYGGCVVEPDFAGGNVTLSLTTSVLAIGGSGTITCTLPSAPKNGQTFEICKATTATLTISLTGSNGTHTINGTTGAVAILTAPGKTIVNFVGGPANMWITK